MDNDVVNELFQTMTSKSFEYFNARQVRKGATSKCYENSGYFCDSEIRAEKEALKEYRNTFVKLVQAIITNTDVSKEFLNI